MSTHYVNYLATGKKIEDFFNSSLWPIMFYLTLAMHRTASVIPAERQKKLNEHTKILQALEYI